MASVFSPKARHLVPNFRRFVDTAALGELGTISTAAPDMLPVDFRSRLVAWKAAPNVGLAGDIIGAALVAKRNAPPEAQEAAAFILAHPQHSSPSLLSAAEQLLAGDQFNSARNIQLPRLATFLEDHSRHTAYRRIGELKRAAARFGRDPIIFTELARLYLIVGNEEKAKRNIAIALVLAPNNRYVLRSAARLYAHCDDAERAFVLLHRNGRTLRDPWLASAKLAMAGLIGKSGKVVKPVSQLLTAGDFSPLSLAELRAGVGSIELLDGDRRRSKKLLQSSLESPNDNALAQVEWALSVDPLFSVDQSSFDVGRNYEALALEAFQQEEWRHVVRHCESWLMDMPFASRPVTMATHVASVVLEDYKASQAFCRAGLLAAPLDRDIANSYAYALALDGQPEAAFRVLNEIPLSSIDDPRQRIVLTATHGLAHFRSGDILQGRLFYGDALERAATHTDIGLRQVALLNYAREELLAKQSLPASVVKALRELKIRRRAVTTEILKSKVLALLDAAPENADMGQG